MWRRALIQDPERHTPMTAGQEVRSALDQAQQAIAAASALVAEGQVVDLAGLDEGIGRICGDIAALPKPERLTYKPQLLSLIDALNRLVGMIEARHGEMAAALSGVASRRSAVSAYGKSANAGDRTGGKSATKRGT